jgi:hypothetical protein
VHSQEEQESNAIYGRWPWIVGLAFGAALIVLMFELATGFS